MTLTPEQERRKHELEIRQMETNIIQMEANIEKMKRDARFEMRKIVLQTIAVVAAGVGAGIALANYVNSRPPPAAPAAQAPAR